MKVILWISVCLGIMSFGSANVMAATTYIGTIVSEFPANQFGAVITSRGKTFDVESGTIEVSQKDKVFSPPMIILPQGGNINFKNDDTVKHNVWSMSKTRRFDLGLYDEGEEPVVHFPRTGTVEVFCNIHAKMYTMVWVVDSPFYAVPDENYRIQIPNIPDGLYTIEVMHYLSHNKPQKHELIIQDGKIKGVTRFVFEKTKVKTKADDKKDNFDDY